MRKDRVVESPQNHGDPEHPNTARGREPSGDPVVTSSQDTASRSLAHWSEDGRAEMEAFYVLATGDYRRLAEAADWSSLLAGRATVLDVACGSGKFPAALQSYAGLGVEQSLTYDLLDPSAFSVAEAKARLEPPFVAGRELVCTLQDLPADLTYDVVWATHALYAVPIAELGLAAERFVGAIAPGGLGFVAQATAAGHYVAFYEAYRAGVPGAAGVDPFTSAEQVRDALVAAGAAVREERIRYTSGTADRAVAQGFLQRCAFDDALSLEEMEATPVLGDYLASCRGSDGTWTFEHEAALLWL